MSDDAEDIAGLLRNEARIARAGDWPHPTCPELLDRGAAEIEAAHAALDALGTPRVFDGQTLRLAARVRYFAALAEPP
jgi:hypothetical protein